MFKGYFIKHCYSVQVEANAIINFRFGTTCFGFGTKKQIQGRKRTKWYNPFPFTFKFNAYTGQMDMKKLFDIGCNYIRIWYTTKGESRKGNFRWKERGLHIRFFRGNK